MGDMRQRMELAEKLEIMGELFELEKVSKLLDKFEAGMNTVRFNAVVVQIESELIRERPEVADKLITMKGGDPDGMDDKEYAITLRNAIITDVMGFFASSPHTDGKK